MSQDDVDNLRAFWETWNTNEAPDMSLLDPEVTYEDTILPDHVGETYRGHEGVARAVARWLEPFAEMTICLERIVGEGDCLVSIHHVRAKARHTGIEFRIAPCLCLHAARREGHSLQVVLGPAASPRRCGHVGVGDDQGVHDPRPG
jgi:hypothetical protein